MVVIMITKLTNTTTNTVIDLDDELYPIDDFNWSPVVSKSCYSVTGSLMVQQGLRKAGKPLTLQSQADLGWLSRATLNQLQEECAKTDTTFWLDYLADETVKRVKVMFDHEKTPIEASPVKEFNSPKATDPFLVTLRFIEVK